jgi:hypothetical protein
MLRLLLLVPLLAACAAAARPVIPGPVQGPTEPPPRKVPSLQLIAGTPDIPLLPDVKQRVAKLGIVSMGALIYICADEEGRPYEVTVLHTSGSVQQDKHLAATIRATFRYKPYLVNGKAVRACVAVVFRYIMDGARRRSR